MANNQKIKTKEVAQVGAWELEYERLHQLLMSVDELMFNVGASNFDFMKVDNLGKNYLSLLKAGIKNVYFYLAPLMEEASRDEVKNEIENIEERLYLRNNRISREEGYEIYKKLSVLYEKLNDFRKRAGLTIRTIQRARIEKQLKNKLLRIQSMLEGEQK